MYKVFWNSEVEIFSSQSLEDALAFALSFHRASNKSHAISVYDPVKDDECITLVRK